MSAMMIVMSVVLYLLHYLGSGWFWWHIDGLVQERHNSIANALELRLSYTNPLIYDVAPIRQFIASWLWGLILWSVDILIRLTL